MNRFDNAIAIQHGACNPLAIVNAIQSAFNEIKADPSYRGTASLTDDPAVRAMVHQLAHICHIGDSLAHDEYQQMMEECKKGANNG